MKLGCFAMNEKKGFYFSGLTRGLAVLLLMLVVLPSSVCAQEDPFSVDLDEEAEKAQQKTSPLGNANGVEIDEGEVYTGQVKRLLEMAGEKEIAEGERAREWADFEEVDDRGSDDQYDTLQKWRMEEELKKPLPRERGVDISLDDLEDHLKAIRPAKGSRNKAYYLQDGWER